ELDCFTERVALLMSERCWRPLPRQTQACLPWAERHTLRGLQVEPGAEAVSPHFHSPALPLGLARLPQRPLIVAIDDEQRRILRKNGAFFVLDAVQVPKPLGVLERD